MRIVPAALMLLVLPAPPVVAATFHSYRQFFGDALADTGGILGLSYDGSVMAGGIGIENESGQLEPAAGFWTRARGFELIGLRPGDSRNYAADVSADGTVFAGYSEGAPGSDGFRWSRADGFQNVGLVPGFRYSAAGTISADGRTLVGGAYNTGSVGLGGIAIRWTAERGLEELGYLPGGDLNGQGSASGARAVSGDGFVVVGSSLSLIEIGFATQAFRWTESDGMQGLGFWPVTRRFESRNSHAIGVSDDGEVVVGNSYTESFGDHAFRWTEQTGMVALGALPGAFVSEAVDMNADGSIVVGRSDQIATLWDLEHGAQNLQELLATQYGLATQLAGWTLIRGTLVSGDGNVFLGDGLNPHGQYDRWIVHLNAVPEPSAFLLAFIALLSLAHLVRHRNA